MARSFAEIQKGQPSTGAVHVMTAGQRRRARTYSQVIADATRGVDAGMAMPSGGKMGEPGPTVDERQKPDWRGHYLGKRDFDAVLDDVRKAIAAPIDATAAVFKFQAPGSLYVRRNLENAADLHTWAQGAGVPNLVPPAEMHVTQVYSREPVRLNTAGGMVSAAGGARRIAPLGDKGAVVLHFDSPDLQKRFAEARAAGASWDHEGGYKPHVTLTYDAGGADLSKLSPPGFPLIFGPEIHEPINETWAEDKGFRKFDIVVPISKMDDVQNLVFGWAAVTEEGGELLFDSQGDAITEDDLEAAFYHFAKDGRLGGEMHARTDAGHMVECMVFTKAKQKVLGIDLGKVGAWVGLRVQPEMFAKVKSGEYPAFSLGGIGRRIEL